MTKLKQATLAIAGGLILSASLTAGAQAYVRVGPPPPPRGIVVGPAPHRGYVYQQGYYRWHGGRYVWVGGVWVRPPYGGAVWVPGMWRSGPNGYIWVAGHWRR
jgi:WXXGXW repeat (2 copies)